MNIRIAIADDHIMVINGLQKMIADYPHITIIDTYLTGEDLLKGLEQRVPDVLLLDIQLPGITGDQLAPILHTTYPDLRILTLTNFDNTFYAKNMLHHGALGYLVKRTDQQTLISAIETVYNYKEFLEPSIKQKIEEANLKARNGLPQLPVLTPREKEVLQFIVNGLTSIEIGQQLHLGQRTVENYRFSLMLKLDAKNTALLVKKAIELGLAI